MMQGTTFLRCGLLLVFLLVLAVGCGSGPKLVPVTGTVTVDGQPAEGLEVRFEPKDQKSATAVGITQADGKYELMSPGERPGTVVGDYIVRIQGEERDDPKKIIKLPPKYNTKSELSAKVESGQQKHDFALETK